MNVYSEVNIIQTFPLPLGFGLNMPSCFDGRSFPCGSPLYACSLCHRLGPGWQDVGQHMGCCGNRGLWFSAKGCYNFWYASPSTSKETIGFFYLSGYFDNFYQFILFIEWLPLNIKLLNGSIHGPMYKWSQRCVGLVCEFDGRASAANISMLLPLGHFIFWFKKYVTVYMY